MNGSRVGGIGPTPPGEQPHHRATRTNTPEEEAGIRKAKLRRFFASLPSPQRASVAQQVQAGR